MDVIDQRLVVREWPLKNPGDEQFFGYVVAVGAFPRGGGDENWFAYADFLYGDSYTRYRLPDDDDLLNGLMAFLRNSVEMGIGGCGIHGKVWVRVTEEGTEVSLP